MGRSSGMGSDKGGPTTGISLKSLDPANLRRRQVRFAFMAWETFLWGWGSSMCRLRSSRPGLAWRPMAKEPELTLKAGDLAPEFAVTATDGSVLRLKDFRGKSVVLYFYAKDDRTGCTREACGFRDVYRQIQKKGAVVLGVSVDPVKSHKKFTEKFQLPFPLLADEDKSLVTAYGVWGEKVFMGRKYLGVHRVTFLIGPDGRIRQVWPKVKPEEHPAEVLAALG